jgi:hypothetical protein
MSEPLCATCGHPRDNHPYRHPFAGPSKDDTIKELEDKLAKAVEAVSLTVRADNLREAYHALPNDHNRIGDKRSRKGHAREAWLRAFRKAAKTSRATLAEIEGEKP